MPGSFARTVARFIALLSPSTRFATGPKPMAAAQEGGPLLPKLLAVLRGGYSGADLRSDLLAGISVGIVAMPLAMAFAIASGLPPVQGLNTAIVAGFVIALLGGSRFQVSGPTGAFVVIIYSIVYRHGYDGLVLTTLMAGVLLMLAGLFRLGSIIKFIPYPVTTGFTAGIAVVILSSQVGDFFGLPVTQAPPEFFEKWGVYLAEMGNASSPTVQVAVATLVLMIVIRMWRPRAPVAVIGVIFGGLLVWGLDLPVATIQSKFGTIPAALPSFQWPDVSMERLQVLLPDAVTIALLAGIESLLTCVVADSMTGDKHYSNMELVAQGAGNLASSVLGGIPATGAIARTATNISCGARTPVAALIHSLTLLVFVLWLSPLMSAIPLACLAAVMLLIAWNMVDMRSVAVILRGPKSDWSVMLLTFTLTVVADLTVAVYVGVVLASLLFMRRMSVMTSVDEVECDPATNVCTGVEMNLPEHRLAPGVRLFTINGPFFFGMVGRFQRAVSIGGGVKVYVLHMHNVPTIDATGIHVLETFLAHRRDGEGYKVVLADVPPPIRRLLRRMGLLRSLGEDNVCHSLQTALDRAAELAAGR